MFGLGKYTVWEKDVNEVGYKPPPKNFQDKKIHLKLKTSQMDNKLNNI